MGLVPGDAVLVHAALRKVGPVEGGVATILAALRDAVGSDGTVLGYSDWDGEGAFDPLNSPAIADNGYFPELLRTTPSALRSTNPGASMAAIGGRAEWFTADHALDYGYGPQSPLGKLVEAGGKTLMLGAPLDTMTLLHHAEHLAEFTPKRMVHYTAPLLIDGEEVARHWQEFDTSDPPDGLADDYFATIAEDFLATGKGKRGTVGAASAVLVEAREIVPFAVAWIERAMAR